MEYNNETTIADKIYIYNKDRLEDIISCPICLEKYKHPRILKCGHSFCTTCLHLINLNKEIVCPLCRKITEFNENETLHNLAVNDTLISLVDDTPDITLKVRKSKSVDSFVEYKKSLKKKEIYYDDDDEYIRGKECCTFQ